MSDNCNLHEAAMTTALSAESIQQRGRELGLDLIGFASASSLDDRLPEVYRPSRLATHMPTVIVVAKRSYAGFVVAHHGGTKQFWGGRILKRLDETCVDLAGFIEKHDAAAFPLSSMMVDMGDRHGLDLCPAGQGSPLLTMAAVEAGLGTLGLNLMLLTPQFGPRVYLGGVLTELEITPGVPMAEELCLGLEDCGRCAAVCPEDAIPRQARRDASLADIRDLDRVACARSSQALGPVKLQAHLRDIFANRGHSEDMWARISDRLTGALWQEMLMVKEGSLTGCSACVNSCPVGSDYEELTQRLGMTPPDVQKTKTKDFVQIERMAEASAS